MKKNLFLYFIAIYLISHIEAHQPGRAIHPHGYWYGTNVKNHHVCDEQLANAIVDFFNQESINTIGDFGCGNGDYLKLLIEEGYSCIGYDGYPQTYEITDGIGFTLDLAEPIFLDKTFDWIISLEVGEHIPKEFEKTFIENIHRHNSKGIILSWATKGQPGFGHFNTQNNDYIKDLMKTYGYINDTEAENFLRSKASLWWFKNTLMVFRKN